MLIIFSVLWHSWLPCSCWDMPTKPKQHKNSCYSIASFRILLQIAPTAEIQQLKFSLRPQRPRPSLAVDIFAVKFTCSSLLCYFHYSSKPASCHFQKSSFMYTALSWEFHPQPSCREPEEAEPTRLPVLEGPERDSQPLTHRFTSHQGILENF